MDILRNGDVTGFDDAEVIDSGTKEYGEGMANMNILGTEYALEVNPDLEANFDGLCHTVLKKIEIKPVDKMLEGKATDEERQARYKEVLRHESIHALFTESGLDAYSDDEILVDWIASQFPKMVKLFNELDCMG